MVDKKTIRQRVEVTTLEDMAEGKAVYVEGPPVEAPACHHPSGFLYMRRVGFERILVFDLMYCPHCGERRRVEDNGRVVASCAAGGEWVPWQ